VIAGVADLQGGAAYHRCKTEVKPPLENAQPLLSKLDAFGFIAVGRLHKGSVIGAPRGVLLPISGQPCRTLQ
jgi:hypothetical protein